MADFDQERHDRFAELFVRHQARVHRFIVMMVPNCADADELFQQTNLTLWKLWDRYDPLRDFTAWACGVARNHVRNFLRSRRRAPLTLGEELLDELAETRLADDAWLEERQKALSHCLDALPAAQKNLVQRCYADREAMKTVAAEDGRTPDALYKAMQRIRAGLFDCINRRTAAGTEP